MRKIVTYILILLACISCGHTVDIDEKMTVDLCIASSELELEDPQTRAQNPLDPGVENTIGNFWLLVYASDGRLAQTEYKTLDYNALSINYKVGFEKAGRYTLVVIANMGGVNTTDPDWPSSGDFKWGSHGGGSLYDLQHKIFGCSLDNPSIPHLFMSGITEVEVGGADSQKDINVMLSRLASKFRVTIDSASPGTYSNVRLQLLNCPARMGLFPEEIDLSAGGALSDTTPEVVISSGAYLNSKTSAFYYANENLSSDPSKQTMIKVLAVRNGTEVSTVLPVSSHGITFRNTFYDIQITLK